MAYVALSEAEKTFILHGVEVCFNILASEMFVICAFRRISAVMVVRAAITGQWNWKRAWSVMLVGRHDYV